MCIEDMSEPPVMLVPLTEAFAARLIAATEGVIADLDAPIEGEVAL